MALIVQKYGGTSVGTVERIQAVAQRVKVNMVDSGQLPWSWWFRPWAKPPMVWLSWPPTLPTSPAAGKWICCCPPESRFLSPADHGSAQSLGQDAISLTGAQVGIVTEAEHTRARILKIKTERLQRHLNEGKVIVVAGFQGISQTR
jgi:aspartate kinase